MDIALMRMLVAVSEEGSLELAGERLRLTQQAVSAQLRRLEGQIGRTLVERRSATTRLTPDGSALLAYARRALALAEDVRRHFAATPLTGALRIGIVEGFTLRAFVVILSALKEANAHLEVTVVTARTARLEAALDNGRLDIILGLQRSGAGKGEVLLTDQLRWVGDLASCSDREMPVRLACFPAPSVAREMIVEALTRAGRPYLVSFESESRAGLRAAILAGVAVSAFCLEMDDDLAMSASNQEDMPALGTVDLFMRERSPTCRATAAMAAFLRQSGSKLRASTTDIFGSPDPDQAR